MSKQDDVTKGDKEGGEEITPDVDAETTTTSQFKAQEGQETFHNISPAKVVPISFSKKMHHTITNSRDDIEQWNNNTRVFSDGYYFIPYQHRRAAMTPNNVRYLFENFDFVRLKSIGFTVKYVNVDQTTWHSTGGDALPTHRAPGAAEFWVWKDNGFWSQKSEILGSDTYGTGRAKLFEVNTNMKTEKPTSWNDRELKRVQWKMSDQWHADVPTVITGEPDIDAGIVPFDIHAFKKNYGVGALNYSHSHSYPNMAWVPTVGFDIDEREDDAIKHLWRNTDYFWPDTLETTEYQNMNPAKRDFTSGGREYAIHYGNPANQSSNTCKPPLDKYIRLSRSNMRTAEMDLTAELQIEYHVTYEGIRQRQQFDYWDHFTRGRDIVTNPWMRKYGRTWAFQTNLPNGGSIGAYDLQIGAITSDVEVIPPQLSFEPVFPYATQYAYYEGLDTDSQTTNSVLDRLITAADNAGLRVIEYEDGKQLYPQTFLVNTPANYAKLLQNILSTFARMVTGFAADKSLSTNLKLLGHHNLKLALDTSASTIQFKSGDRDNRTPPDSDPSFFPIHPAAPGGLLVTKDYIATRQIELFLDSMRKLFFQLVPAGYDRHSTLTSWESTGEHVNTAQLILSKTYATEANVSLRQLYAYDGVANGVDFLDLGWDWDMRRLIELIQIYNQGGQIPTAPTVPLVPKKRITSLFKSRAKRTRVVPYKKPSIV